MLAEVKMDEVDYKEKKELDRFRKSTILSLLFTLLTLLACWKWPKRLPGKFVSTVMDKLSQAPIAHRYENTHTHSHVCCLLFESFLVVWASEQISTVAALNFWLLYTTIYEIPL